MKPFLNRKGFFFRNYYPGKAATGNLQLINFTSWTKHLEKRKN